jgi:hypothetical protein
MEVKISQPSRPGGPPEDFSDLLAAVGPIARPQGNPLALVALELAAEDLLRGAAEHHRPRAGLRPRQKDHALLEVDGLAAERSARPPLTLQDNAAGSGGS